MSQAATRATWSGPDILPADPHARYKIRACAQAICAPARAWAPLACAAVEDYRLNAAQLSAPALACLRRMLAGKKRRRRRAGCQRGSGGN